ADAVPGQTVGDESQYRRTRTVEPGKVVYDDEYWTIERHLSQQRVYCICNQKPVGHRSAAETQGTFQGVPMRVVQALKVFMQREEQLVEAGIGQPGLELHTGGRQGQGARRGHGLGDFL